MATALSSSIEEYPVRMIGLRSLRDENFVQCRVETSVAHARKITEFILKNGPIPEPIVVFDDGKSLYLADGIHRVIGYRKAAAANKRFSQIRAEIRPGTRDDAMVYAAGANQDKTYLKRTPKDIEKGFSVLFSVDGWLSKTSATIANHMGVNGKTASKHRSSYCAINNIRLPRNFVDGSGNNHPWVTSNPNKKKSAKNTSKYSPRIAATTEDISPVIEATIPNNRYPRDNDEFRRILAREGIHSLSIDRAKLEFIPGLHAVQSSGSVVTFCEVTTSDSGLTAIARILCVRQMFSPESPAIIIRYGLEVPDRLLEVANFFKIQFMTIEDFVASLKGEGESTP